MKVWIVTLSDCEGMGSCNMSVHSTRGGAMQAWDMLRLELLREAEDGAKDFPQLYEPMVIALRETDPEKMDNYPHDRPIIFEKELDLTPATQGARP